MSNRDQLLAGRDSGRFLEALNDCILQDGRSLNELASELVALHNDGLVDLVAEFQSLVHDPASKIDFFALRHLFGKALPELDAPAADVAPCVAHLYHAAGQDGAASWILPSFSDYCQKDVRRSRDALAAIEQDPDNLADLLVPTLTAGSRLDNRAYQDEALRLSQDENIEVRGRALYALGRIAWPDPARISDLALPRLEEAAVTESHDQILASVVASACELSQHPGVEAERTARIVDAALSDGDEYSLYAAAREFAFSSDKLPLPILGVVLGHLPRVKPENRGTLRIVDDGICQLLKGQEREKGLQLLQGYLLTHPGQITMDVFPNSGGVILNDGQLRAQVWTRWLAMGHRPLCEGLASIADMYAGDDLLVESDSGELDSGDPRKIIFIGRKAVGYFLMRPITVASFLISLMRAASDSETLHALGELLVDPVLLNYTGKTRDYVERQSQEEAGQVKATIEGVLGDLNAYLEGIRSVGNLAALHPSERHREAYNRQMSSQMAESFRAAEAASPLLSLLQKSVLLYGRKAITHVGETGGGSQRIEMPLKGVSAEVELPRMNSVDPVGLDYICRVFRVEMWK